MGRPPEPVPEDKAEAILDGLYEGLPLTRICKTIGVNPRTVSKWTAKDEVFRADFARAREAGGAVMVDEAQDIADNAKAEDVQVAKLRADIRMKRAACYCPRVFGTKVQVGGDGGSPIVVESKAKAEAELAAILSTAASRPDPGSDDSGAD